MKNNTLNYKYESSLRFQYVYLFSLYTTSFQKQFEGAYFSYKLFLCVKTVMNTVYTAVITIPALKATVMKSWNCDLS